MTHNNGASQLFTRHHTLDIFIRRHVDVENKSYILQSVFVYIYKVEINEFRKKVTLPKLSTTTRYPIETNRGTMATY